MEFEYNYNEAGGVGQFQELKAVSCYRGGEFGGVSSVAFDPQEDLLWAATYGVRVWGVGEGVGEYVGHM